MIASNVVISAAPDPDQQRVAAAVEQPHRDVAAVGVCAEEELALPGRPDRDTRRARRRRSSCRPRRSVSVRWFLNGVVLATWSAQSGAARLIATSTMNSAPNASGDPVAPQAPQRQPPRAEARRRCSRRASSSNAAGPSKAYSLAGSVAMVRSLTAGGRRGALPQPCRNRYFRQNCEPVVLVHGVGADAVLGVHPLGEELRRRLGAVGRDVGLLVHDVLVERRPLVLRLLGGLATDRVEPLVELGVADEAEVARDLATAARGCSAAPR